MLFFASINPSIIFCSQSEPSISEGESASSSDEESESLLRARLIKDEDRQIDLLLADPPESNDNPKIGLLNEGKTVKERFVTSLSSLISIDAKEEPQRFVHHIRVIENCLAVNKFWRDNYKRKNPNLPTPLPLVDEFIKYKYTGKIRMTFAPRPGSPVRDYMNVTYFTPLAIAIDQRNPRLAQTLLNHGANPNEGVIDYHSHEIDTPLNIPCEQYVGSAHDYYCQTGCINLLLEAGADVNGYSGSGRRPLHSLMVPRGGYEDRTFRTETTKKLIAAKADPMAIDMGCCASVMDLAYNHDNQEAIKLFEGVLKRKPEKLKYFTERAIHKLKYSGSPRKRQRAINLQESEKKQRTK